MDILRKAQAYKYVGQLVMSVIKLILTELVWQIICLLLARQKY